MESEVLGCGENIQGQLGVGFIRHIIDLNKSR
jgi:hypothetical protein